jgi:mannosyltransferase
MWLYSAAVATQPTAEPARVGAVAALGASARLPGLAVSTGALALAGLVALSFVLRTAAIGSSLWIDEGLSIGIASHPLLDIPGLLAQDGSPPLYYLALHAWLELFGDDEARARALSLGFALLSVPVGLWAGSSLFGPLAGWLCAAAFAINPFLTVYAQEVRMYSLMALLGLATSAAFAHAFAFGRRRYLPVFAVGLATMLYTHNWAGFFAAGSLAALVPCLLAADDRRALLRDALLAFGAAVLLFAPWVPTLLEQTRHTGAPWALAPGPGALERGLYRLVGGQVVGVALLVGLVAGATELRRAGRRRELVALAALLALASATLLVAFAYSILSPAWATRYLTVLLGPLLLLVAGGLGRAGATGITAALVAVLFTWGAPSSASLRDRSNVESAVRRVEPALRPGALVLSAQPEQVPALAYYLPDGLRYVTPLGPVPDPRLMDWRDALARLRARAPGEVLAPMLDRVPPGGRVLLVTPVTRRGGWRAPWTSLVRRRSERWRATLAADDRFVRRLRVVPNDRSKRSTVRAELYVRRSGRRGSLRSQTRARDGARRRAAAAPPSSSGQGQHPRRPPAAALEARHPHDDARPPRRHELEVRQVLDPVAAGRQPGDVGGEVR